MDLKQTVFYLALLFLSVVTFFGILALLSLAVSVFGVHGLSMSVLAICSAIITGAILLGTFLRKTEEKRKFSVL